MTEERQIGSFLVRKAESTDFFRLPEDLIESGIGPREQYVRCLSSKYESYTFLFDDVIIGMGGFIIYWLGVAEAWSVWGKEAGEKHKRSMLLTARTLNNEFIAKNLIWRLQATLRENLPCSWLEHVGDVRGDVKFQAGIIPTDYNRVLHILKARNGYGQGLRLACNFDGHLCLRELGPAIKKKKRLSEAV